MLLTHPSANRRRAAAGKHAAFSLVNSQRVAPMQYVEISLCSWIRTARPSVKAACCEQSWALSEINLR